MSVFDKDLYWKNRKASRRGQDGPASGIAEKMTSTDSKVKKDPSGSYIVNKENRLISEPIIKRKSFQGFLEMTLTKRPPNEDGREFSNETNHQRVMRQRQARAARRAQ